MMFVQITFCIILSLAQALASDLDFAPPHLEDQNLIFVDFKQAHYEITYDLASGEASAKSRIVFEIPVEGKPLFDLVPTSFKAHIDGDPVDIADTLIERGTTVLNFVDRVLAPGLHTLELENSIERLVNFQKNSVQSAFWMSDLEDRGFLEQFLPSNLDYDQWAMSFSINIVGEGAQEHLIRSNCATQVLQKNRFKLTCPDYFNSSMLYFHLYEVGRFPAKTVNYTSMDGREIPVTVYSHRSLDDHLEKALEVLAELEADYGPWPHPHLLIYGSGFGGMEYAGATRTSFSALGHEMHHSYFARSRHPALGNAGWVDEALASWRDDGYFQRRSIGFNSTKMAGHSLYRRDTDRDAYTRGANLMAYLDHQFSEQGGLRPFLKNWFAQAPRGAFKTVHFKESLSQYFDSDLDDFFKRHIYGQREGQHFESTTPWENPIFEMHPHLTEEQLRELL